MGEPIKPEGVRGPKARDVIGLLGAELLPFVRLVGITRRSDGMEVVRVEVQPEVPADPVNDIRVVEPIATGFDPDDRRQPTTWALRDDFPDLPHTFLVQEGAPKSLCLYDEPYSEQRLHWTAPAYVRRLHWWLSQVAIGRLHQPDQPVEPFLAASPDQVVLPTAVFEVGTERGPQALALYAVRRKSRNAVTYVASRQAQGVLSEQSANCMAIVLETPPQTHRGLASLPRCLLELHEFLRPMDVDILETLRLHLRTWIMDQTGNSEAVALIIVRIPIRRSDEHAPERIDVRAFLVARPVGELGEALGVVAEAEGYRGALVGPVNPPSGSESVPLHPLNPVRDLTRGDARILTGSQHDADPRVVAIGAGALGSQTLMNLVRGGFGRWTVVDQDVLLPHNLVRHALPGASVGWDKAEAVALLANGLFERSGTVDPLSVDVLAAPVPDRLREALGVADIVIDFSASVAVARWMARDAPGNSRRISVFLNPDGTDLVLMAEDQRRAMRLDHIEAQYYRTVIGRKELEKHLLQNGERLRYGRTCRDVTSQMSQDALSVFAGIAGGALRATIEEPESNLAFWQTSGNHSVSCSTVDLAAPIETVVGEWRIRTDEGVLRKLHDLREAALPNETGGVLLGYSDQLRKSLYVVDTIPSPPDSEEWPNSYVRGCAGLKKAVDDVTRLTAGVVGYLGEWHSHPEGAACKPSRRDEAFLVWLTQHMSLDGMPALMAIICAGDTVSWQVAASTPTGDEE